MPTRNVVTPISEMVAMKIGRRPCLSASEPNRAEPSGRTTMPTPKVARLINSAAVGLSGGKNSTLKYVASEAKVRKSYHSRKVPKQAARTTLRWVGVMSCMNSMWVSCQTKQQFNKSGARIHAELGINLLDLAIHRVWGCAQFV